MFDCLFQISLTMLGLKLFSHCKCGRVLIQCLVCGNCHFDFISNSQKKNTSFWLMKSYLSNDFIKRLAKKFFSNWANTTFSCLSFHELLIKHFSKSGNVNSGSWLVANVLNEVLTRFNPFSWWKNGIEDVFTAWLVRHHGRQLLLLVTEAFLWNAHI